MNARTLSRRELLKAAGITGAALAALNSTARPSVAVDVDTPAGFLEWAYAQRSRAATTGDVSLLERVYDSGNPQLLSYERDRARFLRPQRGSVQFSGEVLEHESTVLLVDLTSSGSTASARLFERFDTNWRPGAPPEQIPGATRLAPRLGRRGEMKSSVAIKHEVVLGRSAQGWRIQRDEHDEFYFYGQSPDLTYGGWAAERFGRRQDMPARGSTSLPPSPAGTKGPGLARPRTGHLYYSAAEAVQYAQTYGNSFNASYCNFTDCGGDCANFVSQCLRDGGHPNAGDWGTYNGTCGAGGCGSSANAAKDTWGNNVLLRNFVINQGRGESKAGINDLASGHLVNYDWQQNGSMDHIAITSVWVGGVAHVCSHTPAAVDQHWQLGDTTADHWFTWVYASFHQ
jgi:hypothetical protein